jgi:hypothetical protein
MFMEKYEVGLGFGGLHSLSAWFVPYWFLVILSAFITAVTGWLPWKRWRFSVRTLIVATTLVAVVLGLIVWFSR